MKCKSFGGRWYEVEEKYNAWAKNKALTKDVIVHTHVFFAQSGSSEEVQGYIYVFYDEILHPNW